MEETSANIFNVIEVLQEKLIILTGNEKSICVLFCGLDNRIQYSKD
jgi:hypothetical protein